MKIIDNPIDQYGELIPETKRCCVWCGSQIKRNLVKVPIDQPTNYIVVSQERPKDRIDEYGDVIGKTKPKRKTTWDGQSYKRLEYGYFCKAQCATAYANYTIERRIKDRGKK